MIRSSVRSRIGNFFGSVISPIFITLNNTTLGDLLQNISLINDLSGPALIRFYHDLIIDSTPKLCHSLTWCTFTEARRPRLECQARKKRFQNSQPLRRQQQHSPSDFQPQQPHLQVPSSGPFDPRHGRFIWYTYIHTYMHTY